MTNVHIIKFKSPDLSKRSKLSQTIKWSEVLCDIQEFEIMFEERERERELLVVIDIRNTFLATEKPSNVHTH